MKHFLIIILLICSFFVADAKHITGGEMIYDYLGPGSVANSKSYRITLRLFRDDNCFNCAAMPGFVALGIFNNNTNTQVGSYLNVNISSTEQLPLNALPSCITNPPTLSYTVGYFTFEIELPNNTAGYTITYQTCCRIDDIMNVPNNVGATYITTIPGTNALGSLGTDSSPRFAKGISVVCYNKPFTLDFSATDPNGDSLVYSLCDAFNGGGAQNASYATPSPPPYPSLNYTNGFSGIRPLGNLASINPQTGIISGLAPDAGKYVVSVCVSSYNRTTGAFIAIHRKDFIITVAPCDFAGAQLQPAYISCDGFTFNFENLNSSPLNLTFFWDFGDGDTSSNQSPVHTYAVAGVYTLKLVVNRGGSCSDSTTSQLRVFPGFFPGIADNSPMCKNIAVQFNDATTLNYGAVNYWKWDFGNLATTNDTSRLRNPSYIFNTAGTYDVSLIVGSDRGCLDTILKSIQIVDRPNFILPNDTLICSIDTLQLNAIPNSGGTITWSPNYMINNINSFTPLVSPNVTTTYKAVFADAYGCIASDSMKVNVVNNVTLQAAADTIICLTDAVTLGLNTDALQFVWTPAISLNDPSIRNPLATPVAAVTTYRVVGNIGKCRAQDDIIVRTVPYPNANAGADTTICFGTSVQLSASGGSIYNWTPTKYLSASNISNPVSQTPKVSLQYRVEVRDVLGCPKPVYDSVLVTVAKIIANAGPKDTNVVLGQPLQLNATGSNIYSWSPATWLNNPLIYNPISLPQENISYQVRVSNEQGCFGLDTINVRVFKFDPDLLVPTAFTPGGDGRNDVFRPILIGMRSLDAFRVYNRFGQLVYSTTNVEEGWDGNFMGKPQDPGTFVWYAAGTNYLGKKLERKGSVILIR